jgi:hypothetical protein
MPITPIRLRQRIALGGLSSAQREAIIQRWWDAKKYLPPVLMLPQVASVEDHPIYEATAAVDGAVVAYRNEKMTDDDFGALLNAAIIATGDIVNEDGSLVMDNDDADGEKVRAFVDALPNMAGKLTLTGDVVEFDASEPPADKPADKPASKDGIPAWAWGALAAGVAVALLTQRKR